jgi:hypothetical protein
LNHGAHGAVDDEDLFFQTVLYIHTFRCCIELIDQRNKERELV